jgi:hypothetical protein
LRCLKRKLSDIVFTTMRDDADRQTPQLGAAAFADCNAGGAEQEPGKGYHD